MEKKNITAYGEIYEYSMDVNDKEYKFKIMILKKDHRTCLFTHNSTYHMIVKEGLVGITLRKKKENSFLVGKSNSFLIPSEMEYELANKSFDQTILIFIKV